MDFEDRGMTFQEVDRRYTALKRQLEAGVITDEEFDAQLRQLMVQDSDGRWWAKTRTTGQWHYNEGDAWVPGMPPVYQPDHPPAPDQSRPPSEHLEVQDQNPSVSHPARSNRPLLVRLSFAVVLLLGVGIGTVAALTLLRSEAQTHRRVTPPAPTTQREHTAVVTRTVIKQAKGHSEKPTSEGPSRPAPGYNLIQAPDMSLSVEVPPSWGVETGEDSEKGGGLNSWSYYAGEYLNSSITTAPNLDTWNTTRTSGVYIVASKALTRYSDYELIHSLLYANKAEICTKGPYKDYNRPPYSGKIQTWYNCGTDRATTYTVAAAPEGRECVVVFDARISDEADRKAIEHLIDTFEVNCARVSS